MFLDRGDRILANVAGNNAGEYPAKVGGQDMYRQAVLDIERAHGLVCRRERFLELVIYP